MTDVITKIASPEDSDKEVKQDNKESAPDKGWKELTNNKFASESDLAKGYLELEKKLGEQGDEVGKSRQFAETVMPVLEIIRDDPELFRKVDEALLKKNQPKATDTKEAKSSETTDQEMRQTASDILIREFETKYRIDKLSPEDRKTFRQAIGDKIFELTGQRLTEVDLRRLPNVLENSFTLAKENIDKSKLEALDSETAQVEGGISSVPSSPGKGETVLTNEEADVADKMGLTREQYLEGKKNLTKEKAK